MLLTGDTKMTKAEQSSSDDYIVRFGLARRLEHHINAILFILLVITGLAQRYHTSGWANWVIDTLGGIDMTRLVHRYAGILFGIVIIQHVAVACYGVIFKGWRPTIVINKNDFTDAITNIKYYFGFIDEPARCHRYDYKQKFEYWGVTLGGILMVATGLVLWFPIQLFQVLPFLPGQIIPAAKVTHSNEAMLALLVIVIWHIYNAVFSPEVFPLDTSIFTGKISVQRMKHEHPLEYEELFPESSETPEDLEESPSA
jgi:formate dehydrogenase gamma subunit